ncbi:MAG: hypothetical protein VW405_01300 [Rhodospirillaceae bacterium]
MTRTIEEMDAALDHLWKGERDTESRIVDLERAFVALTVTLGRRLGFDDPALTKMLRDQAYAVREGADDELAVRPDQKSFLADRLEAAALNPPKYPFA